MEFQFCNSKSIELFGFDLREWAVSEGESVTSKIKQPRFVSLERDQNTEQASKDASNLTSLYDILMKQAVSKVRLDTETVESYVIRPNQPETTKIGASGDSDRVIIVKRMDLTFNEKEC